jgi:hypothetical protein
MSLPGADLNADIGIQVEANHFFLSQLNFIFSIAKRFQTDASVLCIRLY